MLKHPLDKLDKRYYAKYAAACPSLPRVKYYEDLRANTAHIFFKFATPLHVSPLPEGWSYAEKCYQGLTIINLSGPEDRQLRLELAVLFHLIDIDTVCNYSSFSGRYLPHVDILPSGDWVLEVNLRTGQVEVIH